MEDSLAASRADSTIMGLEVMEAYPGEFIVELEEMRFSPSEIEIVCGQEVEWVAAHGCSIKHSLEIVDACTGEMVAESPPLAEGRTFKWFVIFMSIQMATALIHQLGVHFDSLFTSFVPFQSHTSAINDFANLQEIL